MSLKRIYPRVVESSVFKSIEEALAGLETGMPQTFHVKRMAGSLPSFLLNRLREQGIGPLLCLMPDAEAAAYLQSDLDQLDGGDHPVLLLPPSDRQPYDPEHMVDPAPSIQRADVLQQLNDGFKGIVIAGLEAFSEKVPASAMVTRETIIISVGEVTPPESLVARLTEQGFKRAEFVEQPGEIALRGGILDVYPFTGSYPIRIEFFGDEIDSIREFDVHSQRSISRLTTARMVPDLDSGGGEGSAEFAPLFSYFPPEAILVLFDEAGFVAGAQELFEAQQKKYNHLVEADKLPEGALPPEGRFLQGDEIERELLQHSRLLFGTFTEAAADRTFDAGATPQPPFNSSIKILRKQLAENHARDVDTFILCDSRGQESRLEELLAEDLEVFPVKLSVESLHEGFQWPDLNLDLYTDHQIFNRYHRPSTKKQRRKHGGISLRELRNLSPGDYVVHIDYGIGKFAGLQQITVRDKQQEAARLLFGGDDVLYVNVNALYKLHKYTGKEGFQPKLTRLGSGTWERVKSRTKKRVKDIARDLIKLYAQRKQSKGYAFQPDTLWQRELEASFQYEDTPDQHAAAEAVKRDMEQPVPMDRLVCGDVGFGKTEIAVRAAFKAVQEGKQVAVLVPTTILASQHASTFRKRLDAFPVKIGEMSRFRSAKEQKETLKGLKKGDVDIVIGTHRLLSKDIGFKDLGLLIIDEEQRFGVAAKEKLRTLRAEVDTLCLTATPIPRTLQFSLMGARDLSIINTPPPNRQPIITEIHTFDKDLIRDAIHYEINRGGQVFFVHNRVQTIEEIADTVRLLLPEVRIQVGHGQMKSSILEKVMTAFIKNQCNVLVSTNIVESGLDVSNANTIIIDRANHFGLADLHQLRGRVGRSDQKAFCYLLVPSIHALTREARQRLQAVEEFSELGSGFNIAMRDLDIRGAGNMLGAEQSGFIAEVGYETYHKILDEAVQELRNDEFSDLFTDTIPPPPSDTLIDVEADALIPETYLSNNVERLNLYRRISEANTPDDIDAMRTEMTDRFGPPPKEVDHLLMATALRNIGQALRLPKITYKNQRLFLLMPPNNGDDYFYEHYFQSMISLLEELPNRIALKENRKKQLRIIVQEVHTLEDCVPIMKALQGLVAGDS